MKGRLPPLCGGFPDAMVIVDCQGKILQANVSAIALFGLGRGQVTGTAVQALFPGQRVPLPGDCSRRRDQAGRHLELVGCRGGDRRFRAAVAVMPIQTENGPAAVMSIRDLTEAQETQFILERGLQLLSTVISSG
jgi:PAS domain S-box-containing protein